MVIPKVSIILISGKQGSGKTTLAKAINPILLKNGVVPIQMTFAEPLYQMHNFCCGILEAAGLKREIKKDGRLLQLLGTEWGREAVDPDIWVKICKGRIENQTRTAESLNAAHMAFIISDCRFKNEFLAFPDAISVRLEANKDTRKVRCEQWRETDYHPSETDLDDFVGSAKYAYTNGKFNFVFKTDHTDNTPEDMANIIAGAVLR